MTVFNTAPFNAAQPLFFGDALGVARFDVQRYPIFSKLTKTMKSFYWTPEEINLQKDSQDFKTLPAHEKHIFTKNIAYQVLLDSIQQRAPLHALLPWVSSPDLESAVIWWSAFEEIHSRSYQWILQNLYTDPAEVFDSIPEDDRIITRAAKIIRFYDDFIDYSDKYRAFGPGNYAVAPNGNTREGYTVQLSMLELKRKLYLALISVYALEAIRFYVSFACSFAFGQQGKMAGNASIIKLIARDETQHAGLTINILRLLKKSDDPEWQQVIAEEAVNVLAIIDEVVDQERDWIKYLFKDGAIIGLNESLLTQYLEQLANKRLKSLGLKARYDATTDPFTWLSSWLNSEDNQVAPQEVEITDYLIGALDSDVEDAKLLDF